MQSKKLGTPKGKRQIPDVTWDAVITRPEGLRSWPPEKQKVNKKLSEKCQICRGKSKQNIRKRSHPKLEISPYLSNFSKEVRQLTDW